jgi:hypothetical protein
MSSAGRTPGIRSANDFYVTPPWCVDRLLDRADLPLIRANGRASYWLDPCAGDGAIIKATMGTTPNNIHWTACELQPAHEDGLKKLCNTVVIGDFLRIVPAHYDVVLTNPPYSLAEEFVRACLPIADHVGMLLRVNWIAGHHELLQEHPCEILVLPDRPSFALNKHGKVGTDSTEYAWFVWSPHMVGASFCRLSVLDDTPVKVRSEYKRELFARLTKETT